jgi:phenylacetate-CoA ligase
MAELLAHARHFAFWTADYVRGGAIRRHFHDLEAMLEGPDLAGAAARHEAYLRDILRHAAATTDFYAPFRDHASLADFPVVDKGLIKERKEAFLAAPREKGLFATTTSGSTGTPFTVYQDRDKRARHQADTLYYCDRAGYAPGTRLHYLRVWNSLNRKSPFSKFMQNMVTHEIGSLGEEALGALCGALRADRTPSSILAFASTYEALCRYLEKHPEALRGVRARSVMAMSEALPEACKAKLREAFSCPVVCRYSNMENGFLAQQCREENNEYHLNWASYHIELLALDGDRPVPPGTMGRIVVTDLFNRAMPLIRYDTGDTGILAETSRCGRPWPILEKVEGRRVDFLYDTQGRLKSPHIITNTMWSYPEVTQFQFVQEDAGRYTMRLNCPGRFFGRDAELRRDLHAHLGADASIKVELVDEIPLLASGKRKKILNRYLTP